MQHTPHGSLVGAGVEREPPPTMHTTAFHRTHPVRRGSGRHSRVAPSSPPGPHCRQLAGVEFSHRYLACQGGPLPARVIFSPPSYPLRTSQTEGITKTQSLWLVLRPSTFTKPTTIPSIVKVDKLCRPLNKENFIGINTVSIWLSCFRGVRSGSGVIVAVKWL